MNVQMEFCYLCFKKDKISDFVNVNSQRDLMKQISYCINIQMADDENFICMECVNNLKAFYEFKKKCRSLQRKLNKINNIEIHKRKKILNDHVSSDDENNEVTFKREFSEAVQITTNLDEQCEQLNDYDICSNITTNLGDRKKDREILPDIKPLQCDICGKIYKDKRNLKKHITETHGEKQYSCKLCHKKFTRAEHKVVHMRAHSGIRPFICEMCARAFTKKQDLLRHMLIHSEEKKFCCSRCDRRFRRAGDVRSHMRSHTGHKPYSCPVCQRSYSSHSGLKKHRTNCQSSQSASSVPCLMDERVG